MDIVAQEDVTFRFAFLNCLDLFYPNYDIQDVIAISEFQKYMLQDDLMGNTIATRYW